MLIIKKTYLYLNMSNNKKQNKMETLKLNPTQQEAVNEKVNYLRRNNLKSKAEKLENNNIEAINELMNEKLEYWKYNLLLIKKEVKVVWSKEECENKIKLYSEKF